MSSYFIYNTSMPKMIHTNTNHESLAHEIQQTHEQWDEGHATILVGSAACLLHLYDSKIDVSGNPILMDIKDVDAIATSYFTKNEAYRLTFDTNPYGEYAVEDIDSRVYDGEGYRVIGKRPHYTEMPFEVFTQRTWSGGVDVNKARAEAMVRDNGQLIMPIADVIRWKINTGRPRDLVYVAQLLDVLSKENYLLPEKHAELEFLLAKKRAQ